VPQIGLGRDLGGPRILLQASKSATVSYVYTLRKMQKNFSLVGFKIFQDALVGFFAPLVRTMTHYGILWQNHCITCAKPYPTKAHNDFHLYSMYIPTVTHPMKPYGTKRYKDSHWKKFENSAVTNLGLCPAPDSQENRPWLPFSHPAPPACLPEPQKSQDEGPRLPSFLSQALKHPPARATQGPAPLAKM